MDWFPRRLKCYYQKGNYAGSAKKNMLILREGGSKGEFQAEAVKIQACDASEGTPRNAQDSRSYIRASNVRDESGRPGHRGVSAT